jgi:hypothetical protein
MNLPFKPQHFIRTEKNMFGTEIKIKGFGFDDIIFFEIRNEKKETPAYPLSSESWYIQYWEWNANIKCNESKTAYFKYYADAKNFVYELLLKKWLYWNNQDILPRAVRRGLNDDGKCKEEQRKMDLNACEEVENINSELANALSFEDKFSKFTALGEVANLTQSSNNIPLALRERILKRIDEEQKKISYCEFYPIEAEDMDEDLIHISAVAVK